MKVGIYSGTFDPVHKGHLDFASSAIVEQELDKVFFLPEPRPRRKQGIKAFEHRVNMLKLATKTNKKFGVIVLNEARFTPESTLPILKSRFKGAEIYMLMGDDMLDHFIEWPNVGKLIENINFIIALRKYDKEHIDKFVLTINKISGFKFNYSLISIGLNDFSSKSIKNAIKKNKDYTGLEYTVKNYIIKNNLYASGEK